MTFNRVNPDRWKADIAQSVDMYNDWFLRFAPEAYRNTRIQTTKDVESTLKATRNLTDISVSLLRDKPSILPTLRMAACPPLARDRLIGLAGVPKNLVKVMEKDKKLPPRLSRQKTDDALVSSSVVWFSKNKPPSHHKVRMTFGGSLLSPQLERIVPVETLRQDPKWTRYPMKERFSESHAPVLSDFFTIKRGLATGNNGFFILTPEKIEERSLPAEVLRPILPSLRHLPEDEIRADTAGNPVLEYRSFLLDCRLPEKTVREQYPTLEAYFKDGKAKGIATRYLCRSRSPWYTQEIRPAAPFLCTYLGEKRQKDQPPISIYSEPLERDRLQCLSDVVSEGSS